MKASELRIGNYVLNKHDNKPEEVSTMSFSSIDKADPIINSSYMPPLFLSMCEPIPLTEEWLVKFGFKKQMAWTYTIHLKGNQYLVYYVGEKGWSIGNKNYSDFNCEHVHTLQNLYFALTNKEL